MQSTISNFDYLPHRNIVFKPQKYETSVIHLHRDKKFKQENLRWMHGEHGRTVIMVKSRSKLGYPFYLTDDMDIFFLDDFRNAIYRLEVRSALWR